MSGLLVLQIVMVIFYIWWRCLNLMDGDFNPIHEGILLIIFIFVFALVSRLPAALQERQDVFCKPYIGQTIMKKQIPNYLIFKDDEFVEGFDEEHRWFETKKVGDLFTKEDCKKIKNKESLY